MNYFLRVITLILPLLFLSACATQMTTNSTDQIKNRTLAVSYDDSGYLIANTGTKVFLTGVFSEIAGGIDGNQIAKKNNIPNPGIGTAKKLSELLAKKYNLKIKNTEPYIGDKSQYSLIARKAGGADLVLTLMTNRWMSKNYFADLDNYYVTIITWAFLIDAKTGKHLVSGSCWYEPKYADSDDAPTWKYLYEDGAKGMKEEVIKSEDYCAKDLMEKIFKF